MNWLWSWEWFPANLCVWILSVIVVLGCIWLIITIIKEIIDAIFDQETNMSNISKELIEQYRTTLLPLVSKILLTQDFEGQGASDRAEFEQDCNEILDLAISALNPTGDLISREALKDQFRNLFDLKFLPVLQEMLLGIIDNAPAVQQNWRFYYDHGYAQAKRDFERPQGEWVVYGKQGDIPITDRCTNCNYEMKWYKTKYNFCPQCGADMQKG